MQAIILGAGRVGSAIALDLAADPQFEVAVADNRTESLQGITEKAEVKGIRADLSDKKSLTSVIAPHDVVINALPGFMGFSTFRTVIDAGKDIVDIAFFPEDPFMADALAKERGVTAIMDCGVAPGISNLLVGQAAAKLTEITGIRIYVGGLPVVREWPYEYKAVFSPADVIEEYTRPARFKAGGKLVVKEALTDRELFDFPEIGTLEAFNTDGLRTLLRTIPCPDMIEKTLRYPGHVEKMILLRDTGFFNQEPLEVGTVRVVPREVTARLLFSKWALREGEEDFTVLRVIIEGRQGKKNLRYQYDLLDRFDKKNGITSMARTTGYTATMAVRLLAENLYREKGVSPPEFIGRKAECVTFMLQGLQNRDISCRESITQLSAR